MIELHFLGGRPEELPIRMRFPWLLPALTVKALSFSSPSTRVLG